MKPKDVRKQIKNLLPEFLPGIIAGELFTKLMDYNRAELTKLATQVRDKMEEIDQRSRNLQSMITREMTKNIQAKVDPAITPESSNEQT